jgi:hypothetical protein
MRPVTHSLKRYNYVINFDKFYISQSSDRYSVAGTVTEWVKLPCAGGVASDCEHMFA